MGDEQEFVPFVEMSEQLSFMDMLQPWPHHLHVYPEDINKHFAACDCGWIGSRTSSHFAAVTEYRDHIERPV